MEDKLTCHCGKTVAIPKSVHSCSVGAVAKATGWNPLMTSECGLHYFCPECWEKAVALAKQLFSILGFDNPYLAGLLREKK